MAEVVVVVATASVVTSSSHRVELRTFEKCRVIRSAQTWPKAKLKMPLAAGDAGGDIGCFHDPAAPDVPGLKRRWCCLHQELFLAMHCHVPRFWILKYPSSLFLVLSCFSPSPHPAIYPIIEAPYASSSSSSASGKSLTLTLTLTLTTTLPPSQPKLPRLCRRQIMPDNWTRLTREDCQPRT